MKRVVLFALIMLTVGVTRIQAQEKALLHVTRVEHPNTTEEFGDYGISAVEVIKVWGHTRDVAYVLSCKEVWKGEKALGAPCALMNAGKAYEVNTFATFIGFPADQPDPPTYAWYAILEERDK
jgi:hypothetical protein